TQLNRQGNDVGTQYRSGIFFHNAKQQNTAQQIIAELSAEQVFSGNIVTEVTAATAFYIAEPYHQGYFLQHPEQGYCQFIVAPKMAKFRQQYQTLLKS
ncbi:MAG TPA: peptide-methionine (S)-S-oxide reductase, partial [Rheinheimera sp.]|nr:peptide-methionine (S)-S-oxide reductase [Rheinheimera sp.]